MNFNLFVQIWIALAVITFVYLFFKPAPYGRYLQKGWGPMISAKLAWIFMETPVLIIVSGYAIVNLDSLQWPGNLLIACFIMHYINRCFIYPFRIGYKSHQVPLTIVLSAVVFNLVNGNVLGYYLTNLADYNSFQLGWSFYVGIILFLVGMIINLKADNTLMQLRKGGNGYVIPKGGLYGYISCPNYFGELIEWLGFALAVGHLAGWSFFIWSFANLVPRAFSHHQWYKRTFPGYPTDRKVLVPHAW